MTPGPAVSSPGRRVTCWRSWRKSAHVIRRFSAPRPYRPQRLGRELPGPYLDAAGVRRGFAGLVAELERTGYLDQAFPGPCVDDREAPEPDPAAELEKRLGIAGLWPLAPDKWDDSTFYGLIEVYHDLVSRPRERHYHDYGTCGWHYSHFSATAGREVYRWKANELLQAAGISYQLADSGEDLGRLVAVFDDGRSALLAEVLCRTQPDTATRVHHAVAPFQATGCDRRGQTLCPHHPGRHPRRTPPADQGLNWSAPTKAPCST